MSSSSSIATLRELFDPVAIRKCLLDVFEIDERNVTIESEIFAGYIHFISCLYVFPVVPGQLSDAGYDKTSSIEATALACGIGCILSSYITNLPFVIAPPTSVSIYLAVSLQQMNLNRIQGDSVVMLSGCALLFVGIFKPATALVTRMIPDCIQASTAVGIGLITAVAGAIELDLVVPGKFTIVEMGPITPSIIIALLTTILIIYASHVKKYKAAFFIGLVFGTVTWWWYSNEWPETIMRIPRFTVDGGATMDFQLLGLLANLLFLYILTLSGLSRSMSDLAGLTHPVEETIPRGHWLFIICGVATILSGYFSGPPILLSPETAAGIKAGAKTGLSTLVCGLLFLLTIFFCPLFSSVPPTGTSPLLLLVGLTLFTNTNRINWTHAPDAIPAFFVLLLIPFTYSILSGVGVGYALYIGIALVTGGEGLFFWRQNGSWLPSSGALTNPNNSNNICHKLHVSFQQYCQSVAIAWTHWKILCVRCIQSTSHLISARSKNLNSNINTGVNASGNANNAMGNNSNTINASSDNAHADHVLLRLSGCLRETVLCISYACCTLGCFTCMGGLASFLCGDEDDNGDAKKVNSQLLHHHQYALHLHNNPVGTTMSGGVGVTPPNANGGATVSEKASLGLNNQSANSGSGYYRRNSDAEDDHHQYQNNNETSSLLGK